MNGGAVARGTVSAAAIPAAERDRHLVRLVMRESFLGGCELDVSLSAEEAANFASTLYALAKQAMIQNEATAGATETVAA
jgi:hypothetical protein